jgi:toxin-antitoxin system PIN domain toxin
MRLLDVNVLVNALRTESDRHQAARDLVAQAREGHEPVVVLPEVASGFLRIATSPRIFAEPEDAASALGALRAWCSGPGLRIREAGSGRWPICARLIEEHGLVGGDVHDALLAAACLEFGATLVTSDSGFARFASLRVQML